MQFNIISLPVIVASLLMLITGIMIRPFRSTPGVGYFSLLLFSGALYSLFYALELSSRELSLIDTFYKLQYTGIPFIPAFFIVFAISYTRKIYIDHPALLSAIFLVPVLTAMFAFTKDMHDFFITGGHIDSTGAFPVFLFLPGTWYWVHQVYSVTALIAGIILLSRMYIFAAPAFRRQIGFILTGSVIPFIIYILYLARVFPQGLDATPFSFALTGIIIYTGISRFKLFSLFPLACNMLFESIPDSVFVLDKHSRLVDLNKSAAIIFRIGPSDIGRHSDEVFGNWPEILSNITYSGNVRSFDISRSTDDGTVFFHCIISPLVDKRKVERGQMLVIRDVSVQKKAEIKKFSSEEKFRIIFENAPVGLIYFNREGTIEHCNDYFARLLGPGNKSVVGFNVMQFPDQRVTDAYNRVAQGQVAVFEGEYNPGTGKGTIILQVVFKPLFDHLNVVEGGLCFVEDATGRRRTEDSIRNTNEELKRINAEKDRFFSILAHDLRSPFSAFLGYTELLEGSLDTTPIESVREIASCMKESADNLYNLLENLLQWSRMQQGLLKIEPEEFNLKEEVLYSLESLQINAKNKMIGLSYEITDDIKVFADKKMFNTITRNLFTNAVKFTPKGGRIAISAQYSADNIVVICFRDTGIGMSPGRKNNLFRLDVKTSRPGTEGELSTGLGLILVREFIEMHGGSIWVESEENKGSRFFIGLKKSALTQDT